MTDNTALKPKTFHIIYGWAEGPWHGRKLKKALYGCGYRLAAVEEADVIVTHSAGAYLVPNGSDNKAVLLIGVPFWPGRPLALRCVQKVWYDFLAHKHQPLSWLRKTSWNIFYIISQPRHNFRLSHASRRKSNLAFPVQAIIIRNKDDAFCTPEVQAYFQNKIIELPGQHDDCWQNPEHYVPLIHTRKASE